MTKQLPLSGQLRGSIPFAPEDWRFTIPAAILMLIGWALGWAVISSLAFVVKVGERVSAGLTVIAQNSDVKEQTYG